MNEIRRSQRHLPLLALLLSILVVSAGCSEKHRSPTEPPDLLSASASSSLDDAARGGKKPKPPKPGGGDLSLELQPNVWNTNWEHSQGTVSALIRGQGLDKVDTSSIELVGSDAAAGGLSPLRVQRAGNHLRAFFRQSEALDTLDTPERGEVHEVKVELSVDGESKTLTARVRIVGPNGGGGGGGGGDDLKLELQPDGWNMNWAHSSGTVSAVIRGSGLGDVDLSSIELVGTDSAEAPVRALRASLNGNHIRAFFSKKEAFDTLETPQPGEIHEITIRLEAAGEESELTDRIRVLGPSR